MVSENPSQSDNLPGNEGAGEVVSWSDAASLMWRSLESVWRDFVGHLPLLLAAGMVVAATGLVAGIVSRAIERVMGRTHLRKSLHELAARLGSVVVWFLGLMLAAVIAFPGLSPADAVAALGIGSVAVGLAFKDIFENLFAGVLILWRFPFEDGDVVRVGDIQGRVQRVTVRSTLIRTIDGELILVPNAKLYKEPVRILTAEPLRRDTIAVGVAYDSNLKIARKVLREAVRGTGQIDEERGAEVVLRSFGPSSIDFDVSWWASSEPLKRRRCRDEVIGRIKRHLDDAGIGIPFPQRTLWFPDALRVDPDGEQIASERLTSGDERSFTSG